MEAAKQDILWKALSDATRRQLLDVLRKGPRTTGELCAAFENLDRCTVMKHLEVLVVSRLVLVKREGRERLNFLNPAPLLTIIARWVGRFEAQWLECGDRIDVLLEEEKRADDPARLSPGSQARKTKVRRL